MKNNRWPELPLEKWRKTCDLLHMLVQIAGKIRLGLAPPEPEWAHAGLFISPNGITTGPIPYKNRLFAIEFDLVCHQIRIFTNDKYEDVIPLSPTPVAEYYNRIKKTLANMDIFVDIFTKPQEIPIQIPFEKDTAHSAYDPEYVSRFWAILRQVYIALLKFRAPYQKKVTPVNFWWGTFDLSVSLFSGRPADPPKGAGLILRGAMDAEFVETGFWPGDDRFPEPAFYSFTYPQPENINKSIIEPKEAYWHPKLREFIMPYEVVRTSDNPEKMILDFCNSTFQAGAKLRKF